mmetsp:Transcript_45255/g.104980  ORF Transcript_45255/g.104980 Transcript_45255/m.104980 type:complete len:217 (-) Transcript_45255:391-1041(-)
MAWRKNLWQVSLARCSVLENIITEDDDPYIARFVLHELHCTHNLQARRGASNEGLFTIESQAHLKCFLIGHLTKLVMNACVVVLCGMQLGQAAHTRDVVLCCGVDTTNLHLATRHVFEELSGAADRTTCTKRRKEVSDFAFGLFPNLWPRCTEMRLRICQVSVLVRAIPVLALGHLFSYSDGALSSAWLGSEFIIEFYQLGTHQLQRIPLLLRHPR